MQTVFVDDVIVKGRKHANSPGPFSYDKPKPFGTIGILSTFSPRLDKSGMRVDKYDKSYFDKEKTLPGPGTYQAPDTVGVKISNSKIITQASFKFSKSNDRWRSPTEKIKSPSPDLYSPRAALGFDISSKNPRMPVPKIGNDKTNILDFHFKMKQSKAVPGPGAYERFSDFNKN